MRLQCWKCKTWADFNDGIDESILFHVHGWLIWGYDPQDQTQFATCYECVLKDNEETKPVSSTVLQLPSSPFDKFFAVE